MKEISSVNNETIKEIAKLKNKKYRDEKRKFFVEGFHLVSEAKKKNILETVLIVDKNNCIEGIENIIVTKEIIEKISYVQSSQGIIGICSYLNNNDEMKNNILILDDIQDPGNLGTIIRSAVGFNYQTIIASFDTVDIYNDKVIRATQGAIFNSNFIYRDLKEEISLLRKEGYTIYGTSLNNAVCLNEINVKEKHAIILGNEANGVKKELLDITDCNIFIEIGNNIESLNVAIAGSIIMYSLRNK